MKKVEIIIILLFLANSLLGQVFDSIPDYQKYSPKGLHKDLDFLLRKFEEIHPNYYKETPKDTVLKRYAELKNKIRKPMTRLDFINFISPVVFNVIKDGHNFIFPPEEEFNNYIKNGGKLFPVPVRIYRNKLYCNSNIFSIPYNSEILSINGLPSSRIIETIFNSYNPENTAFEENFFSDIFSKQLWYNFGGFQEYIIEYFTKEDLKKTLNHPGLIQNEIDSLRIKKTAKNYTFEERPEINAGLIHYNVCDDLMNFRPFCDSVFTILKTQKYENLIIDIRSNLGGSTTLNDVLLEYITDKPVRQFESISTKISPEKKSDYIRIYKKYRNWFKWYHYLYYPIYIRINEDRKKHLTANNGSFVIDEISAKAPRYNTLLFSGKIFLLTSAKTYSSASALAAAFKCYNLGTIVGQETGEPTVITADWLAIELPETKIKFAISFSKFVFACGKNDGHGVIPDYEVDNSNSSEYSDREMDFVKKLIQK
jgi:hypothetical protein